MNAQRPLNVTIAAILLEVFSALNLVSPLIGASDEVPAFTGCLHAALGVAGLVASAGLWILKKWGVALAIVVSVLNALSATPGVSFAPTADLFGSAVVAVAVFASIAILVILPGTLRTFT
jgi:hypothetical protein